MYLYLESLGQWELTNNWRTPTEIEVNWIEWLSNWVALNWNEHEIENDKKYDFPCEEKPEPDGPKERDPIIETQSVDCQTNKMSRI